MIAATLMFILPAALAFAGLWLTLRNRKRGRFLLACLPDLSTPVLPGESVSALQTPDRTGDDPAHCVLVLGSSGADFAGRAQCVADEGARLAMGCWFPGDESSPHQFTFEACVPFCRNGRCVMFSRANVISMLGSGMNSAAVAWYILQATHSEMALGTFAVLQTLPAMLMLPFTGVLIDREDRRRLVMMLDAARAVIILVVAILAFTGKVKVWQLYLMNTLVAAGFWMFWPTITALIQELTPGEEFVHANTFLLAGIQGGWLIAGSIVGFVYNHIGLGGVLLIDFSTYLVSFLCYLARAQGTPRGAASGGVAGAISWPPKPQSSVSCARCARASIFFAATAPWSCWESVGRCFWAR